MAYDTTTLSNAHKMIRLGVAAELRVGEQSQGSRTGMGMGRFRELFAVGCGRLFPMPRLFWNIILHASAAKLRYRFITRCTRHDKA